MPFIFGFIAGSIITLLVGLLVWEYYHQRAKQQEAQTAAAIAAGSAELAPQLGDSDADPVDEAKREADLQRELANRRRAELSETQAQLERLQASFNALQAQEAESNAQAKLDAQLAIFEQLSSMLVQLPTVEQAVEQGADVSAADVLALVHPLHQAMSDMGFKQIGAPGQQVSFDPRLHQANGSHIEPGQPARVKFVGYQYQEQILRRAQVSGDS